MLTFIYIILVLECDGKSFWQKLTYFKVNCGSGHMLFEFSFFSKQHFPAQLTLDWIHWSIIWGLAKPSHFLLSLSPPLQQTWAFVVWHVDWDKLPGHVCVRKMVVDGTVINRLTGFKGYSLCFGISQKESRINKIF